MSSVIILEKTPAQKFSKALVSIKFSQLIINDLDKIENVAKRNLKEQYLLDSYIINLVACWQTFVENLLEFAVENLTKKDNDEASKGTDNELIAKILKTNMNERLNRFNTPNPNNIDTLMKNTIGIDKIMNLIPDSENVRERINSILEIRHSIAHTGFSGVPLTKEQNFLRMEFLLKVATDLEHIVVQHIRNSEVSDSLASLAAASLPQQQP